MNRITKFRAWDKHKKTFIDSDVYAVINRTAFGAFGVMIKDWKDYKEGEFFYDEAQELAQFTGLKDKNSKEIYEGDIVHIEYFKMAVGENLGVYETEAELTGVVEFDGLSLILQNIMGEKWQEYTGYDAGEGNCKFMYLGDVYEGSLDSSYQIEVIGNIYENPELLNK